MEWLVIFTVERWYCNRVTHAQTHNRSVYQITILHHRQNQHFHTSTAMRCYCRWCFWCAVGSIECHDCMHFWIALHGSVWKKWHAQEHIHTNAKRIQCEKERKKNESMVDADGFFFVTVSISSECSCFLSVIRFISLCFCILLSSKGTGATAASASLINLFRCITYTSMCLFVCVFGTCLIFRFFIYSHLIRTKIYSMPCYWLYTRHSCPAFRSYHSDKFHKYTFLFTRVYISSVLYSTSTNILWWWHQCLCFKAISTETKRNEMRNGNR